MITVTHSDLKQVLKRCYYTRTSLYIWGATGIGKSETVKKAAQELATELKLEYYEDINGREDGFGLIDVRLSQFDPSDIRGLPYFENSKSKWAYPDWLPRCGKGVVFFDELNLAPPLVQASAYQLILDRKLGSYKLPEGWLLVAAGNRLEDRARVFEMAAPLCNRFIHLELKVPSIEEWTKWATSYQIDPRIVTFLNFKPSYLFKFDVKIDEKAFPTPRSWSRYCSPLIKGVQDIEQLQTLIASAVGEGVATECLAYLKLTKKIDVDEILKKPELIKKLESIDMKYALLSVLTEKAKKHLEEVIECCKYLEPEFAILLLRFIKGSNTNFVKEIQHNSHMLELIKSYFKYLVEE